MKRYVLLLSFIVATFNSFPQQLNKNECSLAAEKFMTSVITHTDQNAFLITDSHSVMHGSTILYHVFNIKGDGFVMISPFRNVVPVLGYSRYGEYTPEDHPPQFESWMEQYRRQILYAVQNAANPSPDAEYYWQQLLGEGIFELPGKERAVDPMLISTWNQGLYYNQMCPEDPAGPGGHCYAGCVATAMGQVCYYFRWPLTGTGSYTYQHPDYGTITADFGATEYKWNQMENSLSHPSLAVAELLFHLGVSVDMDYGPDGSGMWNHKAAYSLRTYFKYAPETQYLYRDSTNLSWDSAIIAHLDRKIPLYYAGWSVPNVNGHAFVCDGYQGTDYFHFNWGWGGSYDGYFYLDELTPGGSNFNLAQEIIINACPDSLNYTYPVYCSGDDTCTTLFGTLEDGSGPICDYANNNQCSWLISPQSVMDSVINIEIGFDKFETEAQNDVVAVYDGPDINAPLLGEFSGQQLPPMLTSSGNEVFITFVSDDAGSFPGWFISYNSTTPEWCNGLATLTAPADTIEDGSGYFYYHNGTTCMWNIAPENCEEITLAFLDFDTEEEKDIVKIFDGDNNQLLAEYSGYFDPADPPAPVTCESGKMFVTFSSNATVTKPGWKAHYMSLPAGLEQHKPDQSLYLLPNPADDQLLINIPGGISEGKFTITVIQPGGKTCIRESIYLNSKEPVVKLDVRSLHNGIYMILMDAPDSSHYAKFMICR